MMKPVEKMTELEKLQHENAELKEKVKELKHDSNCLRWDMMSDEAKDAVRICYKMLVKEEPTMFEWSDFKNEFMNKRSRYYIEKNPMFQNNMD